MAQSVLVTGVSGYIGGHVARILLEKGYNVRGTVRDKSNATKVNHLLKLFPKLELFEADLLKDGTFDDACKGCVYVFHIASPFQRVKDDPQKELVDPALKGTLNVLNACQKAGTVKRIVLTSSCAAVARSDKPEEYVFSEADWNDGSSVTRESYRYSKYVAEQAAWKFAKDKEFELITICPSFVLGPPLSSRVDSLSVSCCKGFLDGSFLKDGTLPNCFGCVDVRDVALAHVLAAENPKASGRYICGSSEGISHWELSRHLVEKFSAYGLPTKQQPFKKRAKYNNAKVQKELGIKLTPISKSMVDMANTLIEFGVVAKK